MRRTAGVIAALVAYALMHRPTGPPLFDSLQPIPRIRADQPGEIWKHVLLRQPAIIEPAETASMPRFDEKYFLDMCGERNISLMSLASRTTLRKYTGAVDDMGLGFASRLLERVILGTTLKEWFAAHDVMTINHFAKLLRSPAYQHNSGIRFIAEMLPVAIRRILVVVSIGMFGPPYLADQFIGDLCPALKENRSTGIGNARQLLIQLADDILASAQLSGEGIRELELEYRKRTPGAFFYWGSEGSQSYPLHSDLAQEDGLFIMLQGAKQVAVVPHASWMQSELLPGTTAFGIDTFGPTVASPWRWLRSKEFIVEGWSGIVEQYEMLYLPTTRPHALRNMGESSVAVMVRLWKASMLEARYSQ